MKETLSQGLFDLTYLMKQIEENDGEITDDMLPALSKAEITVTEKIDSYVFFHDHIEALLLQAQATLAYFKQRVESLQKTSKRMKENARDMMHAYELIELNGVHRKLKLMSAGGVQKILKPEDMFEEIETVNPKYLLELNDLVEEKLVYVLKDKDEFKKQVKENKIHGCKEFERGKYVKFI